MGFVKPIRSTVFAIAAVLAFGNLATPAQAAATATPLYLSFEAADALGAEVAKPSLPGHLLGSWYDGATTAIVPTPSPSHDGQALSFLKAGSAYAWSGFTAFDGGSSTIYTTAAKPTITMDYYSPSSNTTPVELKLEVVGNPSKAAYKVVSAASGWNTLTFDMSSGAKNWSSSAGYNRMSIIPNFQTDQPVNGLTTDVNNGQKYMLDNISVNGGTLADVQTGGPAPAPSPTALVNPIYLSFEAGDGNGANTVSTDAGLGAFNGATAEIASVPTSGGHSGKGVKFTKVKTGDDYSGLKFVYGADAFRYTNAAHKIITFDYYASVASPVQAKLETANGDSVVLTRAASAGWNALSFDMSEAVGWSDSVAFNLVTVFPDWSDTASFKSSIVTKNDQLFYIDNVSINGGTISDVGTQPTPSSSASPTASPTSSSTGVTCSPGTPTIRLLAPNTDLNGTPTGYNGVWQYLDPGTVVYSHYFPLRSTVAMKYQALDSTCAPVAAGTKVFLAVNAAYSKAKTSFLNIYHGAVTIVQPIAPLCAADQYCGDGQTVLEGAADANGQVTFTLTNLNAVSPEGKPASGLSLPTGTMLLQSVFSPSFSNYHVDPFTGIATGAGASNLANHEAVDVIWPNFANGLGDVAQPADATVTPNTTKSLTYTVRDAAGNPVANHAVTVTTDDGGILVSPSSAGVQADSNGFTTVAGTTDAQGKITVVAKSTTRSVQTIKVTSAVSVADPAITAINGYNTITWGVPQTIAAVAKKAKVGQSLVLPAKTSKANAIKWTSTSAKICTVKGNTLKAIKVGICTVTGTAAAKGLVLPVASSLTITVTKK